MSKKETPVYLFQVIIWGICSVFWFIMATNNYMNGSNWTIVLSNSLFGIMFLIYAIGNGRTYYRQKQTNNKKI